jgi:hypothetical protein
VPLDPQQFVIAASMPGGQAGTVEERLGVMERASRNSLALPRLEAWHLPGAAGEPAFQGGWGNLGTGWPVAFYKGPDDVVRIRGVARRASPPAAFGTDVIFTLPAAYRPAQGVLIPVWTGNGTVAIGRVDPNGNVYADQNVAAGGFLTTYLDPLQYRTT